MNHPNLPSDVANDTEVERIKARIRRERFVWFDPGHLLGRAMLLGAICGMVGGAWWWCAFYLQWYPKITGPFPQTGVESIASVIVALCVGSLYGSQCSIGLVGLTLGILRGLRRGTSRWSTVQSNLSGGTLGNLHEFGNSNSETRHVDLSQVRDAEP